MYDPGNLTSETENGDQRSSNIGDQDPSAMSKLAITGGDKETHLSTGWKSTCNYDHQDGVKEERTTVVPKGSYSPGSSDEAQLTVEHAQSTPYSITTATKISLGRSLRTYEDGNKKERRMPQRSDSSGSSDGECLPDVPVGSVSSSSSDEDSETASSDEETDGVPFNYCNIAVPLKIFELYFAIPGSAFNQCIDKLQLKNLTNLRTILKEQTWEAAIMFFLRGKTQIMKKNCFGNPYERLLNFAERDHLLEYQQCYPQLKTTKRTSHDIINTMTRKKFEKGNCSLQGALDWVLSGNPSETTPFLPFYLHGLPIWSPSPLSQSGRPPPYSLSETPPFLPFYLHGLPIWSPSPLSQSCRYSGGPPPYSSSETTPFLPFYLHGVIEKSSQLPTMLYYKGILYKLAGVIFHRSDKPSGGNDHYVVRGNDPKQDIWVYNTNPDGGWEKDRGDPITDPDHEPEHKFTLSTAMYIIADPPESDQSSTGDQHAEPRTDIHLADNIKYFEPPKTQD